MDFEKKGDFLGPKPFAHIKNRFGSSVSTVSTVIF